MKRAPLVFASGAFVLSVVAEAWLLGAEYHGQFWWSHVFGFFALLGLVGCLAIVFFAKLVLGPWLERKENYYDRKSSL